MTLAEIKRVEECGAQVWELAELWTAPLTRTQRSLIGFALDRVEAACRVANAERRRIQRDWREVCA